MGIYEYDRLVLICERILQKTSFKLGGSLSQGTASMLKIKMLSTAGVMHMDHIILKKTIGWMAVYQPDFAKIIYCRLIFLSM